MNEAQHRNLLELVKSLKAKVLLSGYPSELYDTELVNWNRVTKDTANHSSHEPGKDRMTECIWMNF
jgi:DNA adenine methylase